MNGKDKDDERFAMIARPMRRTDSRPRPKVCKRNRSRGTADRKTSKVCSAGMKSYRLDGALALCSKELMRAIYVEAPDKSGGRESRRFTASSTAFGFISADKLIKTEQV